MNRLNQLKNVLNKNSSEETNTVRTLYLVMEKVGGYEQLMNLTFSSLKEIIKCMEHFAKEEAKAMKKR